jgi:hypothetical protein
LVNFGTSILFSPVYFNGISLSLKKIKKMADMFFLLLIVGVSNLKQKKRETQDIPLKYTGENRMEVPKLTNNQPAFYL